jgi:hypothetical protein
MQGSKAAGGQSDLSAAKAGPYVVNIQKVDANNDGKITEDEFKLGCKGGWVQAEAKQAARKWWRPDAGATHQTLAAEQSAIDDRGRAR